MWKQDSSKPSDFLKELYNEDDLIDLTKERPVVKDDPGDDEMRNPGPDPSRSSDFLEALYHEEELIIKDDDDVTNEPSDDEDSNGSTTLPFETVTATDPNMADVKTSTPQRSCRIRSRSPAWSKASPIRTSTPQRSCRIRSRSPVWSKAPPIRQISTEDAVVIRQCGQDGSPLADEDFFTPDQHNVFEYGVGYTQPPFEHRSIEASTIGRGRGWQRGRRKADRSAPGHPITEIYLTDDDIPEELVTLAKSVIRQRESRRANRRKEVYENASDAEDVYEDAEDWKDIFTDADAQFNWYPMDSFRPTEEQFKPERTGASVTHSSAYSAFRSYWDDEILTHIVQETNAYAAKTSASFHSEWVPTNIHEVLVLFSFWMMLAIIRMPTYKSCFSTDPLLETTVFRRMFTRRRYETLMRALHFDSEKDQPHDPDILAKIRPILTHLNTKFQTNYIPAKNICIDESLLLWKGSLSFQQYYQNRSKGAKFGIKTFELCESATGYLWSFFVSSGKHLFLDTGRYSKLRKSTAAVLSLIEPLLNKGYRLFMDHWFSSPLLARFLKRNGTDCVGTLRADQQYVPPLLSVCKLKQGQMLGCHSGDVCVVAWQGKEKVTTISTCHGLEQGLSTISSASSRNVYKPQVVLDYKKYKGGVDLKDDMLEPYLLERKRCYRWYMKLFKRFLNCSIINARILLESSTSRRHDNLDFRLRLVDEILNKHLSLCPVPRSLIGTRHTAPIAARHPKVHWPMRIASTPRDAARGHHSRRRCFWCFSTGRKNTKTAYQCEQCDVPLCVDGCFKSYHLSN